MATELWSLKHEKPLIGFSMGHNYKDPGAVVRYRGNRVTEFECIEKVTHYIEQRFAQKGLSHILYVPKTNHLTTEELLLDSGMRKELSATIKFLNQHEVDLAIELHFNKHNNPQCKGTEVFYCLNSVKGEALADFFSGRLSEWCGPGVAKDDTQTWIYEQYEWRLGFVKNTHMPAILLEPCFMSNPRDLERLMTNWRILGDIITEMILDALRKFWGWKRIRQKG